MIFLSHTCLTARQVLPFYYSITKAMQCKKGFIWNKNLYSSLPAGRFRFNPKSLNDLNVKNAPISTMSFRPAAIAFRHGIT